MLPTKTNFVSTRRLWLVSIFLAVCCWFAVGTDQINEKQKVIIDTDAGADDAMAILMTLSSHSTIDVIAISCVYGNTAIDNVAINVLKTLDTAGRLDIPVYVGSDQGLVYYTESDNYFGEDGFGDFDYPNPPDRALLKEGHASKFLANAVSSQPGVITILALGPLSNIALARHLNPNFFHEVKEIIFLGGTYAGEGNMRPGVEFNVFSDPEAAAYVFSVVPPSVITMVPYEISLENTFPMDWRLNKLGKMGSKFMELLNKAERVIFKQEEWFCFDPTAASVLLDKALITKQISTHPIVETCGTQARGVMFHDKKKEPTTTLVTQIDKAKLETMLFEFLG